MKHFRIERFLKALILGSAIILVTPGVLRADRVDELIRALDHPKS
jgi:hypothetical protein